MSDTLLNGGQANKLNSSTIARQDIPLILLLTNNLSVKIWDVDHVVPQKTAGNRAAVKATAVAAVVVVTV